MSDNLPSSPSSTIQRKVVIAACFATFCVGMRAPALLRLLQEFALGGEIAGGLRNWLHA
jgi:hypothetical protein